uniref:Uncharacterized protein n=1 Tax=Myripristis murdjan TaxID=586833 RepID=A0A668AFT6_9TELE
MIQSSQPSSLKFTCRAFLLHLDLDFFPCLFPCRLLNAVLLLRRGPSRFTAFSAAAATRMAFSCWDRPLLSSPSCRRSTSVSDLPSVTLSWKQSCFPCCCMSHTSRTSQPDFMESRGSRDLESSSLDVWKSPGAFLNILNSAPTSSSLSERVETSNRYFCLRRGECKRSSARIKKKIIAVRFT